MNWMLSYRCLSSAASILRSSVRISVLPNPHNRQSLWNHFCSLWKGFLGNKSISTITADPSLSSNIYSSLLTKGLSSRLQSGLVWWFGVSTFGVGTLIALGGVTRLTRSGLSMTEWSFAGERPPMKLSDWEKEFAKYKQSPEFKRVNQSITMDEFKFIYWMEYAHRMWGRSLGFIFGLPAIYFFAKKAISQTLGVRIGLLMLMGGTQGLLGWWMVKSGLQETKDHSAIPRVSPYRLAAHLSSAVIIYSLLLWTTLSLRKPQPILHSASYRILSDSVKLQKWLASLSGLIGMTMISGAFVAGNDAGRSYNTFPKMNGKWIPDEYLAAPIFSKSHLCENTASVQFHHRILAMATGLSCVFVYLKSCQMNLHPATRQYLFEVALVAMGQMSIGITALLYHVPVWIGSAHQIGALVLVTLMTGTFHSLRMSPPTCFGRAVSKFGPSLTACGVLGTAIMVTQMQ